MMSTKTIEELPDWQPESEGKLRDLRQHGKIQPEKKPDYDDLLSIGSVSPSPAKDAQATGDTRDTKLMELIAGQSLNKSGTLAHLQLASPLESVRELVEVEEACDLRIPGELMASQEIFPATTIRYMSLTTEGLGHALEGTTLGPTTQPSNFVHLESPMTEACSSVQELPDASWLQEDCLKNSVSECQQVEPCSPAICGDQKEAARPPMTPSSANSGFLEIQLSKHCSVTALQGLLNCQEEQMCQQAGMTAEAKPDDELGLDSRPNSEEIRGHSGEKEDTATTVANQSLIEVLTSCKAKVEQFEQLRSSSFDLSAQLRSAQLLAASLHQRVLCLEHEHCLKERELRELTAHLEKTSEALEARNSEMATITKELHQLHSEVEAKKNMPTAARTVTANGQATPDSQLQSSRSSKMCTLL
ncbi:uncharacterized protein [Salminus brasiliensis]